MKDLFQKQLMDTFSERLQIRFRNYCEEQKIHPSNEMLITYIIDRSMIPPVTLQNYAIIETFEELNSKNSMTKTQIVEILANRFNLSSRSIWNILSKFNRDKKK